MSEYGQPNISDKDSGETNMKVSIRSGIERWFDVGGLNIRYWASAWTGREIVSVIDGDKEHIVSDKRSFRFNTPHEFDFDGRAYRLDLKMAFGFVELQLYRDGQLVDFDRWGNESIRIDPSTGRLDWRWAIKKLALPVVAGGIFGAAFGYLAGSLL